MQKTHVNTRLYLVFTDEKVDRTTLTSKEVITDVKELNKHDFFKVKWNFFLQKKLNNFREK